MRKEWDIKTLGDLSKNKDAIVSGPFGSNLKVSDYKNSGVPILRLQNIGKGYFIDKDIKYISEAKAEELKYHSFISGDIALAKLGIPVGKTCIIPDYIPRGIIVADVVRIRPDKKIVDYKFLEFFLNTDFSVSQLTNNISGATRPRVNLSDVREIKLRLPPLSEQKRIVEILDETFAAINKAKANVEKNLQNARELFESYLQNVFENKGEDWEEKKLEDLVDEKCTLSYGIVQPGEEHSNGLPIIRPTDLTSKFISLKGLKRIDPKLAEGYKRTKLIGDELFLCVRGSTGVVSIALKELKGANVTRGIVPIRFNPEIIRQEFGYYLLISNYIQKQIKNKTYGAALMQINIGDLRKIETPFPPIQRQQIIVQKLDAISSDTKKLETIYQQKLNDLEELKKSILQKAFSGELMAKEVV